MLRLKRLRRAQDWISWRDKLDMAQKEKEEQEGCARIAWRGRVPLLG